MAPDPHATMCSSVDRSGFFSGTTRCYPISSDHDKTNNLRPYPAFEEDTVRIILRTSNVCVRQFESVPAVLRTNKDNLQRKPPLRLYMVHLTEFKAKL